MIDAKIDETTNDLVIENGDIVQVIESEDVAQALRIHLQTISTEWILDVGIGVRYFDKIFPIEVSDDEKILLLKKEILKVSGVKNILEFEMEIIDHTMHVDFEATTDYGNIVVEVSV